jgi:hypothetical protein
MAVPADLRANADELRVEGRSAMSGSVFVKEDFAVGDYQATDISHGGRGAIRYPTFAGFQVDDQSTVAFTLKSTGVGLRGTCVTEGSEGTTQLTQAEVKRRTGRYACACGEEASPAAGMVLVLGTPGFGIEGTLSAHGAQYTVRAIYDLEGAGPSTDPTGYRVDGAQGIAGAVDVLGGGRAWMSKSLDPGRRADLACLFVGLFLYRPPSGGSPPATR